MLIRAGFEISFKVDQPTPLLAMLSIHPTRNKDLRTPSRIITTPEVPIYDYVDSFGNVGTRLTVPAGGLTLSTDFVVEDEGLYDQSAVGQPQLPIEDLPDDALIYLLGSRYCETDRLIDTAWGLFGHIPPGWQRVQAIVEFAHHHIEFGYQHARPTKTAWDAYQERLGVCRDYAHLAITLCRCMNIPARYCTGYLPDINVPVTSAMDFAAWMDVYLGNQWYTFDPRNLVPRVGRILMARGRDATDAALTTVFGPTILSQFDVRADEVQTIAP